MAIKRTGVALISITLLYFCSYQGGEGIKFLQGASTVLRHAVDFSLLTLVAVVGMFGFWNHDQKWILKVWISLYVIIILVIGVLGIIDLFARFNKASFRDMFGYLRLFFTSPVPFAVLLFLAKRSNSSFIERKKSEENYEL